jgi:hypothetical protein
VPGHFPKGYQSVWSTCDGGEKRRGDVVVMSELSRGTGTLLAAYACCARLITSTNWGVQDHLCSLAPQETAVSQKPRAPAISVLAEACYQHLGNLAQAG